MVQPSQQTIETVNQILMERFEVPAEKLLSQSNLKEDLGLDSLDFVDMVVVLEEKSNEPIPEFDFTTIKTLNDVYCLVETTFKK